MSESKLYKELGILTKDKSKWEENIPYVSSLLDHDSAKIQAKALWLLGEMGLEYPDSIQDAVPAVVSFCDSEDALLRERAVNALGRIGRGNYRRWQKQIAIVLSGYIVLEQSRRQCQRRKTIRI